MFCISIIKTALISKPNSINSKIFFWKNDLHLISINHIDHVIISFFISFSIEKHMIFDYK